MFSGSITDSHYLAASLIGFATGTAISVLLLVLTVRAAKLPGTSVANTLFVTCCLVWNLGGLAHSVALTLGALEHGTAVLIIPACQFTAAAAWPITVFRLWSPLATQRWQKIGCRSLEVLAMLTCAAIVVPLWRGVLMGVNSASLLFLKESTAYNGGILLGLGISLFRDRLASQSMRLPFLAMLAGGFGSMAGVLIQQLMPFDPLVCDVLRVVSEQMTLFIVLGAFFLFARFRFSDLFIRYCLKVVLAALTAVAFTIFDSVVASFRFEGRAAYPGAARAFVETLAAVPTLFLFTFADHHIGEYVERWIFRAPDYRALLKELQDELARLRSEREIANAVETAARQSLDLKSAESIALERIPEGSRFEAIGDDELVEPDGMNPRHVPAEVELQIPVRSEGRISHILAISPGPARRALVTHEVNYLRSVAAQFGHRLDGLRMEERRVEVESREAVLQQQVTEAELRALRAQINPHFLFNSLNSIANLVVTNPQQAETMTLRLARVFRHVLANSARPLISLHEEIEFLQTYLQIEEARFGNRLQVNIAIDPAVAMEQIPSLILQPIVENALKHGLGPKPGPGHLWITAEVEGNQVLLRIEDDGVGPGNGAVKQAAMNGHSNGVGLENVAQRLDALYRDQGRMTMEVRQAGGTRVTILLPRESGAAA